MRKQVREPAPGFLAENWEQWGVEWERRLMANPGCTWDWRQVGNERVNQRITPRLKAQTREHCSFCDFHPVRPPSDEPIEHFRPKRLFPRLAWQWENLFHCCRCCQSKGDQWDEALLKPDAEDYEFSRYFFRDFTNGRLEAQPGADAIDRERAEVTIRRYGLNEHGHPAQRLVELERRSGLKGWSLDRFSYRDFMEAYDPIDPAY